MLSRRRVKHFIKFLVHGVKRHSSRVLVNIERVHGIIKVEIIIHGGYMRRVSIVNVRQLKINLASEVREIVRVIIL